MTSHIPANKFPPMLKLPPEELREHMRKLARITSPKRRAASIKNGSKGGRPRKP